jgi:hypothetical protein
MVTREALEYLEVNLHTVHVVVAVQTQGRFANGVGQEYAEVYMLDYWRPGFNSNMWVRWKDRSGKQVGSGFICHTSEEQRVFVLLVLVLYLVPRSVYNFLNFIKSLYHAVSKHSLVRIYLFFNHLSMC